MLWMRPDVYKRQVIGNEADVDDRLTVRVQRRDDGQVFGFTGKRIVQLGVKDALVSGWARYPLPSRGIDHAGKSCITVFTQPWLRHLSLIHI